MYRPSVYTRATLQTDKSQAKKATEVAEQLTTAPFADLCKVNSTLSITIIVFATAITMQPIIHVAELDNRATVDPTCPAGSDRGYPR